MWLLAHFSLNMLCFNKKIFKPKSAFCISFSVFICFPVERRIMIAHRNKVSSHCNLYGFLNITLLKCLFKKQISIVLLDGELLKVSFAALLCLYSPVPRIIFRKLQLFSKCLLHECLPLELVLWEEFYAPPLQSTFDWFKSSDILHSTQLNGPWFNLTEALDLGGFFTVRPNFLCWIKILELSIILVFPAVAV